MMSNTDDTVFRSHDFSLANGTHNNNITWQGTGSNQHFKTQNAVFQRCH